MEAAPAHSAHPSHAPARPQTQRRIHPQPAPPGPAPARPGPGQPESRERWHRLEREARSYLVDRSEFGPIEKAAQRRGQRPSDSDVVEDPRHRQTRRGRRPTPGEGTGRPDWMT